MRNTPAGGGRQRGRRHRQTSHSQCCPAETVVALGHPPRHSCPHHHHRHDGRQPSHVLAWRPQCEATPPRPQYCHIHCLAPPCRSYAAPPPPPVRATGCAPPAAAVPLLPIVGSGFGASTATKAADAGGLPQTTTTRRGNPPTPPTQRGGGPTRWRPQPPAAHNQTAPAAGRPRGGKGTKYPGRGDKQTYGSGCPGCPVRRYSWGSHHHHRHHRHRHHRRHHPCRHRRRFRY